jgi:hypothetical protein
MIPSKLGPRLKVVAVIDPAIERATASLQAKRDSFVVSAYKDTRVFKTIEEFVRTMSPRKRPRVVMGREDEIQEAFQVAKSISDSGHLYSAGYFSLTCSCLSILLTQAKL